MAESSTRPARIALSTYSSPQLASSDARHRDWVAHSNTLIGRLYETRPIEPFWTTVERAALGGLGVSFAQMTGQEWHRTPAAIRADRVDLLTINWRWTGSANGNAGGRAFRIGPGSLAFIDLAAESWHRSEASEAATLVVPRAMAIERWGAIEDLHGLVIDNPVLELLGTHLAQLRRVLPLIEVGQEPRLAGMILDMVDLGFKSSGREVAAAPAGQLGIRRRASALIESMLNEPDLDMADIGQRLGISRSQLARVFEPDGGVHTFIRNRRLDHARATLLDPANRERIGDIALRLNFSDPAHFSRAFRARFGITPRELRAAGEGAAPGSRAD